MLVLELIFDVINGVTLAVVAVASAHAHLKLLQLQIQYLKCSLNKNKRNDLTRSDFARFCRDIHLLVLV